LTESRGRGVRGRDKHGVREDTVWPRVILLAPSAVLHNDTNKMVIVTVKRAVRVYGVSGRKKMEIYACWRADDRIAPRAARGPTTVNRNQHSTSRASQLHTEVSAVPRSSGR